MENFTATSNSGSARSAWMKMFIGLNLVVLVLAVLDAWLGWRSFTLSTRGSVASGTVVRLLEDGPAFDADFTPVVEFQVDGNTYTVQSQNTYRWWNRYLRFPVGGEVEVRYDSLNPETAEINSWWDIWNETILLGVFTIIAGFVGNAYLRFRWQADRVQ